MFDTHSIVNVVNAPFRLKYYIFISNTLPLSLCSFFVLVFIVSNVCLYTSLVVSHSCMRISAHCCCIASHSALAASVPASSELRIRFQSVHNVNVNVSVSLSIQKYVCCLCACWMWGALVWVLKINFYSLFFRSMMCSFFWCVWLCERVAKQREQVVCFGVMQRFSWTKQSLRHGPAFSYSTKIQFNKFYFAVSSHHLTERKIKVNKEINCKRVTFS